MSRGFLLIGDSLYDRIGRWDGKRFYVDVGAGGYDFAEFGAYIYATTYAGALYRFRDGIRWGGFLGYYWAVICGLWRCTRASCLWGITTEGVELCWRSAWGACL